MRKPFTEEEIKRATSPCSDQSFPEDESDEVFEKFLIKIPGKYHNATKDALLALAETYGGYLMRNDPAARTAGPDNNYTRDVVLAAAQKLRKPGMEQVANLMATELYKAIDEQYETYLGIETKEKGRGR